MDEEKAPKHELIRRAESALTRDDFERAGSYYKHAGEMEKAKECYIKAAERFVAEAEAEEKTNVGFMAVARWSKLGGGGNYSLAAYNYEKAGEHEKAKECYIKEASELMADGDYVAAVENYKDANLTLTELPKESQEKLLGLVSKGHVAVTQSLAELVKSEEEELMFNEVRAWLVL
jgi:tetratricopeptide (TPR) repeat protein